jgi:type VI secretion system secreted protein VgrG
MSAFKQDGRLLKIDSPLGPDVLLLTSFNGREELSRPFEFNLEFLSEEADVGPADLVGQEVTCTLKVDKEANQVFHGHISHLVACEFVSPGLRRYTAIMSPLLWFLKKKINCRNFQGKDVKTIVEIILGEHKVQHKFKLHEKYPELEYCVQYRESDFDFISRLLEEAGIFFFFKHTDGGHEMFISDSRVDYYDLVDKEVRYYVGSLAQRHVTTWEHRYEFISGKWAHSDYDFKQSKTALGTDLDVEGAISKALPKAPDYHVYDYPGRYEKKADGKTLVQARMQQEESQFETCFGEGNCLFSPGGVFKLSDHASESETASGYVVVSIEHNCADYSYVAHGGGGQQNEQYSNRFWSIPSGRTYRPERITPKARVEGPQTAVVVGPDGEEIYTDSDGFGRVRVKFPWDHEDGRQPDDHSCWVRVSHVWAGKHWGAMHMPRIGQEVIVDFLEGDPDRPIITGRVYNDDQTPPYDLPANKTQSGIKSRSSLKGGAGNFNEIRFEDKKGSEEVYFHAEKDQQEIVENDQTIDVGNDRNETIGRDRTLSVDRHKSETVKKNKSVSVGEDHTETISGDMALTVEKNRTMTVQKDLKETVSESMTVTVTKDRTVTVEKNLKESVTGDVTIKVDKGKKETIAKAYSLQAKSVKVQAADEIILQTGKATISMKKSGDITISGNKIAIKGTGAVTVNGSKVSVN